MHGRKHSNRIEPTAQPSCNVVILGNLSKKSQGGESWEIAVTARVVGGDRLADDHHGGGHASRKPLRRVVLSSRVRFRLWWRRQLWPWTTVRICSVLIAIMSSIFAASLVLDLISNRMQNKAGPIDPRAVANVVTCELLSILFYSLIAGWPWPSNQAVTLRWNAILYEKWRRLKLRHGIVNHTRPNRRNRWSSIPKVEGWPESEKQFLNLMLEGGRIQALPSWSYLWNVLLSITGASGVVALLAKAISTIARMSWGWVNISIIVYACMAAPLLLGALGWQMTSNGSLRRRMIGWKAQIEAERSKFQD